MKKTLLLLILLVGTAVKSQNIFKDDFASYPSDMELSGQGLWSNSPVAPNVGIGACLPATSGTLCSGAKIIDQNSTYLNYGSSTKSIEIGPLRDGVAHIIDPIVTAGDLYVGLVLNLSSAPDQANSPVDFLRIINNDPTQVTFRLIVKNAGFGYQIGVRKGATSNPTVFAPNTYNYNESVLVIMKYSQLEGMDDDLLSLFVNPDFASGEPIAGLAATSAGLDQSGAIDRVAFRLNYNTIPSMPTGSASLISVSTTWEGLSFLPLSTNEFQLSELSVASVCSEHALSVHTSKQMRQLTFQLHSISGALLDEQKIDLPAANSTISLNPELSSGIYLATLQTASGEKFNQKIIIP